MNRVEMTIPMIGLLHMQVCAVDDATDEEILAVCNEVNAPTGDLTQAMWSRVVRARERFVDLHGDEPGPCEDHPGRTHFLVTW